MIVLAIGIVFVDTLSILEYNTVYHALLATLTCHLCAFLFVCLSLELIDNQYKIAINFCVTLLFAALLHSFILLMSWQNSYLFSNGSYICVNQFFDGLSRYADWLCTLPLLLISFINLFKSTKALNGLLWRLSLSAVFMIACMYLAELAVAWNSKVVLFTLSSSFLMYIIYILSFELSFIIRRELLAMILYLQVTRLFLIFSWLLYPLMYLLKTIFTYNGVHTQLLYCCVDLVARIIPVLLCFSVAYFQSKSNE